MKRQEIGFSRTRTTSCSTGEVLEDEVDARMSHGTRNSSVVIAKIKWMNQNEKFDNWRVEWTAHSVTQRDIEQVLSKLVELNREKANVE